MSCVKADEELEDGVEIRGIGGAMMAGCVFWGSLWIVD